MSTLKTADKQVYDVIIQELRRQKNNIELIASENFVSPAVLEAMGSIMTNKYAEGYPGHRYYGGCEYVDQVENIAIARVKELFAAEHANVQPHSGSQANMAVYLTMLEPGDTVLGMNLSHGGHLTHGSSVNFSGKLYNFISYGVDPETHLLDYDEVYQLALQHKPKLLVAGASSYPRTIDFALLGKMARELNIPFMVDMAHIAGLVATGAHPSPVPYADFVTSTTHKTLRGPRGGLILCKEEYAARLDKVVFPGVQGGPLMHIIAAKAVGFAEAATDEFKTYIQAVVDNAAALAEALQAEGLTVITGGTDTHLLLVDVRTVGLTGKRAEELLDAVGITTNKNAIPFDPESPRITSGIRLGTPAVTTRGMDRAAMKELASLIMRVLRNPDDIDMLAEIRGQVTSFAQQYPLPGEYQLEKSCIV